MDNEYVGITREESALIRTMIYAQLKGMPLIGVDGDLFHLTEDGTGLLISLDRKLANIELPG